MRLKHKIILILLGIACLYGMPNTMFAQLPNINELVKEGVLFHDTGDYEGAITKYQEALQLDSTSTLANYEIAYSYYALKKYSEAQKHCLIAMNKYSAEYLPAALLYGSIFNDLGNPEQAIKYYKKLLKTYPNEYLLHYNLAISYSRIPKPGKAQQHFTTAIINNIGHASSHLALGELMYKKKRRVESLLPLYFFLVIEPDSKRSSHALNILFELLNAGSSKTAGDSTKINLYKSEAFDLQFSTENTLISMNTALKDVDSEIKWFYTITKSLFESLAENYTMNPGIWRDVYVPIFADLVNSDHFVAYCYYITQNKFADSKEWVVEHPYMVDDMFKFINN